jgi:hypothetical protein
MDTGGKPKVTSNGGWRIWGTGENKIKNHMDLHTFFFSINLARSSLLTPIAGAMHDLFR